MALTVSSKQIDQLADKQFFRCLTCGTVEVVSKSVSIIYHRHDGSLVVLTATTAPKAVSIETETQVTTKKVGKQHRREAK